MRQGASVLWGCDESHIPFYDYSKHNYMALPVILVIAAIGCYVEPAVCVDVQTLETELFTQKDAVVAIEAAEWNAELGQSHNDTIWSSSSCVHVERIACDDNTQAETYFK